MENSEGGLPPAGKLQSVRPSSTTRTSPVVTLPVEQFFYEEPSPQRGKARVRRQKQTIIVKEKYLLTACRILLPEYVNLVNNLSRELPDWSAVVAVHAFWDTRWPLKCPICLEETLCCPRMTRCGHIFCNPCLHAYFANLDVNVRYWKRCPLCFDSVVLHDVKPVRFQSVSSINSIDDILSFALVQTDGSGDKLDCPLSSTTTHILPMQKYVHVESQLKFLAEEYVILRLRQSMAKYDETDLEALEFVESCLKDLRDIIPPNEIPTRYCGLEFERIDRDDSQTKLREMYQLALQSNFVDLTLDSALSHAAVGDDNAASVINSQLMGNVPGNEEGLLTDFWGQRTSALTDESEQEDMYTSDSDEYVDPWMDGLHRRGRRMKLKNSRPRLESPETTRMIDGCSPGKVYYFYQSCDGQLVFLSPRCVNLLWKTSDGASGRMLVALPDAKIMVMHAKVFDHSMRKRFPGLAHVPLGALVRWVDIDLRKFVSVATAAKFASVLNLIEEEHNRLWRQKEQDKVREAQEEEERKLRLSQRPKYVVARHMIRASQPQESSIFPTSSLDQDFPELGDHPCSPVEPARAVRPISFADRLKGGSPIPVHRDTPPYKKQQEQDDGAA